MRAKRPRFWIDAAADSGDLALPPDAGPGRWSLSATAPDGSRAAKTAASSFFVAPRVVPTLKATRQAAARPLAARWTSPSI